MGKFPCRLLQLHRCGKVSIDFILLEPRKFIHRVSVYLKVVISRFNIDDAIISLTKVLAFRKTEAKMQNFTYFYAYVIYIIARARKTADIIFLTTPEYEPATC